MVNLVRGRECFVCLSILFVYGLRPEEHCLRPQGVGRCPGGRQQELIHQMPYIVRRTV